MPSLFPVLWTALQSALLLAKASRNWMQPLDCLRLVWINWKENVGSGKHWNRSLLCFSKPCLSRSWAQQQQQQLFVSSCSFCNMELTLQMGKNPEANQLPPSQGQGALWGRQGCLLPPCSSWNGKGWDGAGAALRAVLTAGGSSSRH